MKMKDIHKKWIKRSLAVIILFCLLLQIMRGTITASNDSSQKNIEGMHFIVRHWHADGSSEDIIEGYLREDGNCDLMNGKVAEVIPAEKGKQAAVKLIVKPKENETFTGFATAAGNAAVSSEMDEAQPNKSYLTISYNQDIHLAKVHVFYKDTLQEMSGADLGLNETEIREDGKVYNTSQEGLHTDKTISEAAGSDDGRTFDLTLESWYVGNNQANVGMVLDASGSMAFTSNDLEPIEMTAEQINKYGTMQYIPQEEVNTILNPLYTDNSKLGYSGYTYFVYDPSKDTKEYVPIGYWNGVVKEIRQEKIPLPQPDKLIGYYPFDEPKEQINEADKIKGGEADNSKKVLIVDKPAEDGKLEEVHSGKPVISSGTAYIKKALDWARAYRKKESSSVQLDINPDNNSFTISFAVSGSSDKPLMWIGNPDQSDEKAWYAIYADTTNKQTRVVSGIGITTAETGRSVEGKLSKTGFSICTYVFEFQDDNDTKVTIYADGQKIAQDFVDSGIISEDNVIILGGSPWADDYAENPLWDDDKEKYLVDELYVYNDALTGADVEVLYGAMHNPAIETIFAATVPSDKEETMAGLRNADTTGNGAGWYLVSSSSIWNEINNEQLLTSKSYRGIPKDEVIYNRIDEVPEGTKEPYEGNTPEYIYTGNSNFQGNDGDKPAIGIASEWNGSIIFYIDNEGYLRCFFNGGTSQKRNDDSDTGTLNVDSSKWSTNGSYCSYVYKKSDLQRIKTEALQYALGSFVTRLGEVSPDSQVSAVRFGTQNLVVDGDENTTNENLKSLVLLDWTKNTMDSTGMLGLIRGEDGTANECEESINGIMQYNYILTGGTSTWTGLQSYVNNLKERDGEDSTISKNLIIFTDGKDTTGDDGWKKAETITKALKDEGYTIYCVMLQSAGNRPEEAKDFLEMLASSPEYAFYADDVETLTEVFTTKILDNLVGSLSGYTVQDYIDPRFNLVAADGTVIYLNKGGNISVDGNSIQIGSTQGYEVTVMDVENIRGESGEKAMLYYDDEKDMYYIQWQNQTIPACGVDAATLDVWKSKITVRAKDDFIGGNVILTNGNMAEMNLVFDPDNKDGNDSKSFPSTAANVALLKLTMKNELETIYKGQTISPKRLRNILGGKVESNAYYEYLERYLSNISEQEEYEKIISALESGSAVEIPYMYLPDNTGTNQTGKEHKNDRTGTLIYQWQACEDNGFGTLIPKTENPEYDDFVADDTNSRYYRLTITYEPLSEEERKEENNKLTSNEEYTKPYYCAGKPQNEIKASGVHQTDIVSGELVVEARVLLSDLLDMARKNNGLVDMEESFTAVRTYNGEESTIKLKLPFRYTTEELLKLLPEADGDGYISIFSEPFTELPIGEYRISADNVTALEFGGISKRDILDGNGHFSEKYSIEGKESMYAADSLQEENNNLIIFYLGIESAKKEEQEDSSINLNARLGHVVISYGLEADIPISGTVSVVVEGIKHLSGRTLKQGEFVFDLIDGAGKIVRKTTNEADGSFRFDKLTFDKVGIYTYIVYELENNVNGVTYDKKYYLVQIQVEKQEGILTAKIIYKRGEQEQVEKPEFYNKYEDMESIGDGNPLGVATGDLENPLLLKAVMCIAALLVVIALLIRKKKVISK